MNPIPVIRPFDLWLPILLIALREAPIFAGEKALFISKSIPTPFVFHAGHHLFASLPVPLHGYAQGSDRSSRMWSIIARDMSGRTEGPAFDFTTHTDALTKPNPLQSRSFHG